MAAIRVMMDPANDHHYDEHFCNLRAMSLPDMTELTDIVALDKVIHDEYDEGGEANVEHSSSLEHPVRLFLGLHRSMSMPKQDAQQEPEEAKDDFYFPDDESEISGAVVEESFLPKFYSNETLASVIPPPGVTLSPKVSNNMAERIKQRKNENVEKVKPEVSTLMVVNDCSSDLLREAAAKKTAHRQAALSSLSAFFGSGSKCSVEADTQSPTSTIQFPTNESETLKSGRKTRSESLPTCSEVSDSQSNNLKPGLRLGDPSLKRSIRNRNHRHCLILNSKC